MTTGDFTSFPIDKIWVNRAERQRRELVKIPELMESIKRVGGLINPITIQRDGQLRAGERRWTACKELGWTHIPVQFVEDLDEVELQLLELEENVGRVDLSWQDECLAVARYHQMRGQQTDGWTQSRTAEALGISPQSVGQKIDVARELQGGNTRVLEAPKFSTARNVVQRVNERKAATVVDTIRQIDGMAPAPKPQVPLLHADFHEWSSAYTGNRFNLIHCDFPYGINAGEMPQGQGAELGGYADGFDVYTKLLDSLEQAMYNVVADSAHLIFWFSMDYYELTKTRLTKMGWTVNPFPLIWYKSDNTGIAPDPQRGPRRVYETAFFASRGDRKLTARGLVNNAVAWPGRDKSIHMSEKPVGMLKHFMGMVVDEYSVVLDPTAGSANALKAATALGAPTVLGLERDEEFYNRAKEAYFNAEEV